MTAAANHVAPSQVQAQDEAVAGEDDSLFPDDPSPFPRPIPKELFQDATG